MSIVRKLPNLFFNLHVTAPIRSRKWLSDAYSLSSGAVSNRTYRVGAKRFQTAPCRFGNCLSDAYSLSSGAVSNRTYRVGAKRFVTAPTGLELSGFKPHLPALEEC